MRSEEEIKEILKPYINDFVDAFRKALKTFKKQYSNPDFNSRVYANILNRLIIGEAKRRLLGKSGIVFPQESNRGVYVYIGDALIVRLKKFDKNLQTSNIKTDSAEKFLQQIPLDMQDMPPEATNIFIGYQWNEVLKEYTNICVACPQGEKNLWDFSLLPDEEVEGNVINLYAPEPVPERKQKRVGAKRSARDEEHVSGE